MKKYCVIGKSLPHTLSPQIHAMFGRPDYGVREFANKAELAKFVKGGEYGGYNVTIPYKQDVIPLLDAVSQSAKEIGAVNTVVNENGKNVGYNTDIDGISYAFRKANIELEGRNILILGSGGTCLTAKYVCERDGAQSVKVVSRTGEINYENCYGLQDAQVIINTTPVGMYPNIYESPLDLSRFQNLQGVYDCIYNPLQTMLVKQARDLGINAANGLVMLVEQARIAHNLFQRAKGLKEVSELKTDEIVRAITEERRNIVLIGMAGSGKSVIGKAVAKRLGREFADTDAEVENAAGMSIADIFAAFGEEKFRDLERGAVERVCSKLGLVIATGGGAILDEKNRFYMEANGVRVLIRRPVEQLATAGRPLSDSAEKAAALYELRKPLYHESADIIIDNDGDAESAVNLLLAKLGFAKVEV